MTYLSSATFGVLLLESISLLKKSPYTTLSPPLSLGVGAPESPPALGYTRASGAEGLGARRSLPTPPPPAPLMAQGPGAARVVGRSNPESPANRGPLAEDLVVRYPLPGRAGDR